MRDIVTELSALLDEYTALVLSRPLSGFAETSRNISWKSALPAASNRPETDPRAEAVLFVVDGEFHLTRSAMRRI